MYFSWEGVIWTVAWKCISKQASEVQSLRLHVRSIIILRCYRGDAINLIEKYPSVNNSSFKMHISD